LLSLSGPIDAMIVANNLGRPAPRTAGGAETTKSVKAEPPAAAGDRVAPNTRSPVARQCPKTGPNTVDTAASAGHALRR
jgi:hypothetical protein